MVGDTYRLPETQDRETEIQEGRGERLKNSPVTHRQATEPGPRTWRGGGTGGGRGPLVTNNTDKVKGGPAPCPWPPLALSPGSPTGSPISSSSEVIDLERREMAGGGSRLACWDAGKVGVGGRCQCCREKTPRHPDTHSFHCASRTLRTAPQHAEPSLPQFLPRKVMNRQALRGKESLVGV